MLYKPEIVKFFISASRDYKSATTLDNASWFFVKFSMKAASLRSLELNKSSKYSSVKFLLRVLKLLKGMYLVDI